jgi:hypothetical protein
MTATIRAQGKEHVVVSYNDDTGHGRTLCGGHVIPSDLGPRINETITCPKCSELQAASEETKSMTILKSEYERYLYLVKDTAALKATIDAHAREIGKELRGLQEIEDIGYSEKVVWFSCDRRDDTAYSFPIDFLFDPNWKARVAAMLEEEKLRYEAQNKRLDEEAKNRAEDQERKELAFLLKKYPQQPSLPIPQALEILHAAARETGSLEATVLLKLFGKSLAEMKA